MALFKISKGSSTNLGVYGNNTRKATEGYAYFTPDDGKFYIDIATANTANLGVNRIPLSALAADVNYCFTTTNSSSAFWKLTIPGITFLKDGLMIHFKLSTASNTNYNLLNLNGLGNRPIYYKYDQILQNKIAKDMEITLIYREDISSIDRIINEVNYGISGWVLDAAYTANNIGLLTEDFNINGNKINLKGDMVQI